MKRFLAATVVVMSVLGVHVAAEAAEINVLAGGNMTTILVALTEDFERTSGHRLSIVYDRGSAVKARIRAGELVDVVVVIRQELEELLKDGRIEDGSVVNVARSSIGVIVRAGAPKPDMSSADALKRALLAAPSIAYSDPARGTSSGVFFANLLETLGIATQVRSQSTLAVSERPIGEVIAELVVSGQAAIGVGQVSEMLPVPGVEFVTPLAEELRPSLVVAAGISAGSRAREAAKVFVRYLSSPAALKVIEAKGMAPERP